MCVEYENIGREPEILQLWNRLTFGNIPDDHSRGTKQKSIPNIVFSAIIGWIFNPQSFQPQHKHVPSSQKMKKKLKRGNVIGDRRKE